MEATNSPPGPDPVSETADIVSDRRDMKLKEAEKTIANKDVIIQMLQEQVKKLEQCYKQNLKETETFRYRFYLASEQVTRLRMSPQANESSEKPEKSDKPDKDIKSDIVVWKNDYFRCDQLISKECPAKCNKTFQQFKNIARIMKAHYELLQLLSEKLVEKAGATEMDPATLEKLKNEHNDQISKLQEEINSLKEENLRLQLQLVVQVTPPREDEASLSVRDSPSAFPSARDSLLGAYKRTTQELQKKMSKIIEKTGSLAEEILQGEEDEDENEEEALPYNSTESSSVEEIVKSREEAHKKSSVRVSRVYLTDYVTASVEKVDKACDCRCRDAEVQVTDSAIKTEQQIPEEPEENQVVEIKATDDDIKPSFVLESPVEDSIVETELPQDSIAETELPQDVTIQPPDVELESTRSVGFEACAVGSDPKQSPEDKKPSGDDSDDALDKTDEFFQQMHKEQSDKNLHSPSMTVRVDIDELKTDLSKMQAVEQGEEQTEPSIDFSENAPPANTDMNEMILKLNDIGDRVAELLEKQDDTCKEIESLKTELTVTRDSTRACTENICKLTETIDEQKETFLDKFQEHKVVTDNLIHANEEIQQELGDLKEKIETLFRNIEELNKKPSETKTPYNNKNSDEVITIDRFQLALGDNVPPATETMKSMGVHTVSEEAVTLEKPQPVESGTKPEPVESGTKPEPETQEVQEKSECPIKCKTKDQRLQCVNALLSYYKKVQESIAKMNCDVGECTKQQSSEVQGYIDKVKEENVKVKDTISSVLDNLEGRLGDLKDAQKQENPVCSHTVVKQQSDSQCELDVCTCDSNMCDEEGVQSDVEIEDIYNAVRRTFPPCQQFAQSMSSCLCTRTKTSSLCACPGEGNSEEELYTCLFCACGESEGYVKQSQSEPRQPHNLRSADKTDNTGVTRSCGLGECLVPVDSKQLCEKESLILNLQTYVRYLHEQLDIITSIESKIEDMRERVSTH
ncbi:thyroid receptor-interacting protein 11-like isoform X3 [Zophobas morio]|uniref:thyroid receptor-interacting protein 11-like isoform X3 n=1 Tax=Zophobas morio TaxID=2755281 RepID=UPI0030830FBE